MEKKTNAAPAVTSRRDIIAITIFLALVLIVWLGLSALPGPRPVQVQRIDGVINLSDFDFENNVQIISGFENYDSWPQHLYTPEDFAAGIPGQPQMLDWPDYRKTDELQYTTHRLTLLLPPGENYAISMKTAVYAQRLFINGEDIGSVGVPATTREDYVPGTRERTKASRRMSGLPSM